MRRIIFIYCTLLTTACFNKIEAEKPKATIEATPNEIDFK